MQILIGWPQCTTIAEVVESSEKAFTTSSSPRDRCVFPAIERTCRAVRAEQRNAHHVDATSVAPKYPVRGLKFSKKRQTFPH